ncbi:MAG TPA: PadR family transcriptional regulator [Acidobacteriota bacterium]|nr:PadR family transcriptional regulator [Acidobacteriota bacterium]
MGGSRRADLLQGTLDLLILKTLSLGPRHGWGISQRIQQMSDEVFQINQGSLYPALQRLQQEGWIASSWGESENRRRAKYYRLTAEGRRRLEEQTRNWKEVSAAIERVLAT